MWRALALAEKGIGKVSTNPMVGAVIVYDDRVIGEGYHSLYGGAHAEVKAINSVKEEEKHLLKKSVMYVTLEPCCHYGKTPPCTDLILLNSIPTVVIAMPDPFAKVAGEGINILRQNGVQVEVGMLGEEATFLNRRFITFHTKHRPYILLKWAESADGFLDSDREQSTPAPWLTGKAAKVLVHRWRAEEDAIMVGANTVLRDNPRLDVREWYGKNPIRVTIDTKGGLPKDAYLFNAAAETICYTTDNVEEIVADLYRRGIQSILIEGGTKTLQQFIDKGLFDEVRRFTADMTFERGSVKAPSLHGVQLISTQTIANSKLNYFLNNHL